MPREKLSFSPALPELTAPWFVPGAYGKLSIADNKIRIECLGGSMKLKQLGIRTGMEKAVVTTMGASAENAAGAAPCVQTYADGFLTLEFADGLKLCSGMGVELAVPQNMYSV